MRFVRHSLAVRGLAMNRNRLIKTSKFLSYVLRHRPDEIGIQLDDSGWVEVDALLRASGEHGQKLSPELLQEIVATNDKKRFAFSDDGKRIRASQGHSIEIDLDLEQREPPEQLYHGTVERFLESIMSTGLIKGNRHHVHLSSDVETASKVGGRRGRPIILRVDAGKMHHDGHTFYRSANGVWLCDSVPPAYIQTENE